MGNAGGFGNLFGGAGGGSGVMSGPPPSPSAAVGGPMPGFLGGAIRQPPPAQPPSAGPPVQGAPQAGGISAQLASQLGALHPSILNHPGLMPLMQHPEFMGLLDAVHAARQGPQARPQPTPPRPEMGTHPFLGMNNGDQ